jgi:hypothetical protein
MMLSLIFSLLLAPAADTPKPEIVFDNRPETGIPSEARNQKPPKLKDPPKSLDALTTGEIKTVRVRYFDKKTWKTEDLAGTYVAGLFESKGVEIYESQVWSQGVGVPEMECIIEYTKERQRNGTYSGEGRLLVGKPWPVTAMPPGDGGTSRPTIISTRRTRRVISSRARSNHVQKSREKGVGCSLSDRQRTSPQRPSRRFLLR